MYAHGRHPTCQIVKIQQHTFLVDCGEGSQFQMQKYACKPFKIDYILISHLHGDHYFGLIGLLTTFQLLGRVNKLTIICPRPLEEIIRVQIEASASKLKFPLEYIYTQTAHAEVVYENSEVQITTIPLKHRIDCSGFIFKEKAFTRKINAEAVKDLGLNSEDYLHLRQGLDIVDSKNQRYANQTLTVAGYTPRKYAFCTDTLYIPEDIVPFVEKVDLLYHEATFMKKEVERARVTYHSTTVQAAQVALAAQVKHLLIGHFSSRYIDLQPLLDECRAVFPNSQIAVEGEIYSIERGA